MVIGSGPKGYLKMPPEEYHGCIGSKNIMTYYHTSNLLLPLYLFLWPSMHTGLLTSALST